MKYIHRIFRFAAKVLQGTNPLFVEQRASQWDAQYAKGYWDYLVSQDHLLKNTELIVALIEKYSKSKPGLTVLDVGCGNGALLKEFRRRDLAINYTGFDISEEAIQSAQVWDDNASLVCSDVLSFSSAQQYDVIIFNEILYYVPFWKVLSQYQSMAHKDTLVIISMYRSWRARVIWLLSRWWLTVQASYAVRQNNRAAHWRVKECVYKRLL